MFIVRKLIVPWGKVDFMNAFSRILTVGLAGSLALMGVPKGWADLEVSVGVQVHATADFQVPLAAQGVWVDVPAFGHCWRPAHVAVDWRPYCDGQWVWTDAGWYWESDEPWAWACYHYGTWTDDPALGGWVWVPGVEWAPAWVYWRFGGGFVGWAPCPPRGVTVVPDLFSFVEAGRFNDRIRVSNVIRHNDAIVRETREFRDVRRENRTIDGRSQRLVINEGPGREAIEKAGGKHFTPRPIAEVDRRTAYPDALRHRTAPSAIMEKSAPAQRETFTPKPTPVPAPVRPPTVEPPPRDQMPVRTPAVEPREQSGERDHPAGQPKDDH